MCIQNPLTMKYRKCEICGFKSERKDGIKRDFMARYPLDEDRCKKWVKMTGNEDLAYLPIEKLHQLKFVCGKHFKDKDYTKTKTQLKKTAVPSLSLAAKPLSDEKLIGFPCKLFREQRSHNEEDQATSSTATVEIDDQAKEYLLGNVSYICDIPPVECTGQVCTSEHQPDVSCNDAITETKGGAKTIRKRKVTKNEHLTTRKKKIVRKITIYITDYE